MYLNLTPKRELHKYNIKYVHVTWLRLTDSTEHEPTAGQQMNKKPLILIWEKQLGYFQFLNISTSTLHHIYRKMDYECTI